MPEVYIVDAIRTPIGKKNGSLAPVHPIDLGAHVIKAVVERTGIDPSDVDDVVFGCVDAIGGQAGNIARMSWLAAGLPQHVPGVTVDRQCGSSQQAIQFGAQAILAGTADLIIAGGVQNMSQIPISAAMIVGQQYGFTTPTAESKGWTERYGNEEVSQFRGAEMIADKWDISREDLEKWALQSHERAKAAIAEGRFENEIVPFGEFTTDEGPR
jgi:acetyl-CoA C-acetyltransferase